MNYRYGLKQVTPKNWFVINSCLNKRQSRSVYLSRNKHSWDINKMKDEQCDYLVIGGGATGMAFCDTLLNNSGDLNPRVILVDKHDTPGGQWHDSYNFVQLHQPSNGYGVESRKFDAELKGEDSTTPTEKCHRGTRSEILRYYADVLDDLRSKHDFDFFGRMTMDLAQLEDGNPSRQDYIVTNNTTGVSQTIHVRKRLVDARNLEPDLPVSTPPKFSFSKEHISILPVNDIVGESYKSSLEETKKHFVVVGGGKTGMDAVFHLLEKKQVSPENLLWVVPNDAWITARENIGNCMDLLYTAAKLHDCATRNNGGNSGGLGTDFFQRAFIEWEKQGHIYRLDPSVVPSKFKDATLSLDELRVLRKALPSIVRKGRISEITERGDIIFKDGSTLELGFPVDETLFLHCSAGAFHFSKSNKSPPPIFEKNRIVVQDVYGTPGFCFVGSILGKLESMTELSDDERNVMTKRPEPSSPSGTTPPVEKSGGDVIGTLTDDHTFVQRAQNLRMWMNRPELRDWIFANRLFHLVGADPAIVSDRLDYVFKVLQNNGIAKNN